nr:uncharacterized protein LOC113688556 isoform X2 [Coffea arabica]XP_027065029.1 uncharacterized protein LOC113691051 isoform X2 [Coffea arabica]
MSAREEKNMDTIVHFTYRHPLSISTIQCRARHNDRCGMCSEILDPIARVYACQGCSFFLHEHSAELQLDISHPFHPHRLHHHIDPIAIGRGCDACSSRGSYPFKSWYRCEEADCSFSLHLKCALLKPSHDHHRVEALQNSHGHSLLVCDRPNVLHYSCTRCDTEFGDDDKIYVCLECKCMLDEPCAAHGQEIRHPFHSQHTLSLVLYYLRPPRCCSLCGGGGRNGYFFTCSSCDFCLDVDCANLGETTTICKADQGHIQIQPVTHPHPLIQVEVMISMKNFSSCCFACGLRFEDLVYACLSCRILLHKSCADLPNEITSHLHPNHLLKLVKNSFWFHKRFSCRVCLQSTGHFFYDCEECDFGLDVKCTRSAFPLIIQFYFRCLRLDCNFSIHDHCYPSLPPTIKDDCHIHPLTFANYPIKGVPDDPEEEAELYCYACEEGRAFDRITYLCSSCHFVAHVHCVITVIISYLHKEPNHLAITIIGEQLGSTGDSADEDAVLHQLDEEIMRLEKDVQALMAKMGELRKSRFEHISKRTTSRRKFLLEKRDQL